MSDSVVFSYYLEKCFAALYWKKATKQGILAGMIRGFVVCVGWKQVGLPFGIGATVPGTIACAVGLVSISLATYKKYPSEFLSPAGHFADESSL